MKYSNTVEYNISTKLDSSGLTKLQSQIKQLENSMQQMANRELLNSDKVQAAKTQLEGLNTALINSFNSSLGILDLSKFRAELDKGGVSAKGLQSAFNMMGTEGQAALNSLTTQIANFNGGMERTSSAVDKVFTTFQNTFRWGVISSFFSQFMNAIHQSVDYVKELDDSLTQIMLVTDYNRDSMNQYAKSANEAAKALSMSTTGMTNASLIFAQQGYDLQQSQDLAGLSAKLANASQQDTATTSDQITAYMNAYGLDNNIQELTQAMDNWALIANVSAADVSELAQASQRAASMANAVGVSGEALAAQIATIESVTREAPEQIGNGLKTMYARFSDISLGKEDEDGVGLGKVTGTLNKIGVQVLDQFGNIREMDAIMEDLMDVWADLDDTTKTAAAQALAGKYQVNRFEALMNNRDMYEQYVGATGEASKGTLDTMNQEYADSLAGKSQKLSTTLEGLFSTVFNTDDIYPWIDAAQGALDLLQQFFDALGGGKTILLGITTLLSQAFNQNIARNINDTIANRNLAKIREQNIATASDTLDKAGIDRTQGVGKYIADTADQAKLGALSDTQYDNYMSNVKELEESATAFLNAEREMTKDFDSYNMIMNKLGQKGTAAFRSEEGLNTSQGSQDVASNSKRKIQDFELDFSEDIRQAQELEKQLQEVRKALDELHEANKKGIGADEAVNKVQAEAKKAKDILEEIKKNEILKEEDDNRTVFEVGDTAKEVEMAIDSVQALSTEVEEEAREADKQLGQVEERIRTIHEEAVKFSSDPKATQAMALTGDQKLASDQTVISGLEARKKRAEDIAAGSAQSIIDQQQIKNVLDFVQGVQQLTFAWQAFQNLGELWSNKDLLIGEKILQTMMNLSMVIPSVIGAYEKLKGVGSVIQTLGTLQEALAAKSIAAKTATSGFSLANLALAASSKAASGGVSILAAALEGLSSIPVVAIIGAIVAALQYLQAEFRKSQEAATESFNKYGEALNQTQIDTSSFDEAYKKYKETRTVSDELRDSALELTESLNITGGEAFVASGNFDALAKSIEGAKKESNDLAKSMADNTLSRLEANSEKYIPFMQDTFSAEALAADAQGIYLPGTKHIWDENLKLNYFDAFGQDISGMDFEEKIEDISKKSEIANKNLDDLIEKKERLEKKDPAKLTDEEQLFLQDIEEQIRRAQETADVLKSLLGREDIQQYQQITDQEKARNLKNLDSTISNDIENKQSIFNAGTYDKTKDFLLKQEGVDTSNVDILIEKYARLAENEELAAEAALKVRDQQITDNVGTGNFVEGPFGKFEQKAGMWGRDQIDQLAENFGLSLKDKAKISDMIDWTDPTVDSRVQELVEKIQKGLENGVSLDNLLNSIDPTDITTSLSEMKPTDSDIDEDSFHNLASYIHDNWENLEELNEALGESAHFLETDAEYIAEVTEAILRYQDALDESTEKMEDWLEALDSDNLEERSTAISEIKDSMEDLLNLDAGSLSDDFVEAEGNMQLFQDALAGVDGAYNELLEKALVNKFQLDVDNEPAMTALDDCLTALDNFDGYANTDFGPLTLDDSQAISALENVINAFGMSSEAAQEFAKSMGYEIEVEPVDVQQEGQSEMTGWTPEKAGGVDLTAETFISGPPLSGAAALSADLQGGGGTAPVNLTKGPPLSAHIDGVTFNPQTDKNNETKNTPLTQIKTKSGNGEVNGGLKIKSLKRIAPTGGGKAANSTRPSSSGGGGKKGGSCFVAGTQISTSHGFKAIENINKYDSVLSYNTRTKQNEYSSVLQTMIHDTIESIYTLYIKNEQLRVTGIHRFFIKHKLFEEPQWTAAQDLKIGDRILLADGTWHLIWKIDVNTESQTVYNFEVANNHNYYVSRTQILAHNKGGGKGGGGGGGGGGKAKTIEKKDKKEHTKDYYEEVKTQLGKTEKILSKIQKEEDRLIGDKARANQNKQLKILEKEIKLQKEKLKILTEQEKKDVVKAMKDADKELEKLAKKYGVISNIPDAVFDEDGVIQNYEEISKAIDATYNKLIDKRNALAEAGDEEGVKEMDKQLDKFDKQGEKLRKNAKRYDEIQTEIEELNATLEELDDSIEDIRIDAYKASQEAIDNLKELKELAAEQAKLFRDFDNSSFMNKFSIDDTPYGDLIEDLTKLQNTYSVTQKEANKFYDDLIKQKKDALKKAKDADEKQAIQTSIRFFEDQKNNLSSDSLKNGLLGLANQDLQQLQGWIDGTNKESNPFGKNEAALWEAYEDAYKRSLDLFKDYRETIQEFRDDIIDIYDEQEEGIERNIDKYEQTLEELERINDTYQLYYGEESYDNILSIMDQQTMTMQAQYAALQTAYQHWVEEYQKAIALGDEKLIQEIEDKMDDAKKAMLDKAQDLADHFIKRFETAIDGSVKKMVDQIWKGNGNVLSLDSSALLWEYDKDYEETYKDNVEKAFEVDKLRSKYIDLLNDAQGMSLQTQNKIRAQMQEQLDLLSNQATVSEYDVKLANAKLEVLQKQIALEDAQRNKNKMQLRRDTQGNYRYVYTADQGDVKKAQDELAQSEYDAYEMTKQQTSANNDRYINLLQDYANKIAEIDKNMNLEAEEKQKLREELEAKFMRAMKALGEDYQDVTAGMYDVLTWMVQNSTQDTADAAAEMLDTLYDKNGEVKENTGQAWRDFATEVTNSFENVEDAVTTQMQTARAEADKLKDEMVGDKGVLIDIGSGVDTLKESLMGATKQTERWATATDELFTAFTQDNPKLKEARDNLALMEKQLETNQKKTSELASAYKTANSNLQAKSAEALNYKTILDVKDGAKELKVGDRYVLRKGTKVHFHRNDQQWDANNNTTRALPEDVQVTIYDTNEQQDGKQAKNFIGFYRTGKNPQEESKGAGGTNHVYEEVWHLSANDFKNAITYDSGGYTGDWAETTPDSKNGKWALLHQKELILNAKDTENILAATKFVRELVAAKTGAATLSAQLQKVQAQNNTETIEQRVEISATFPNATDADDIRNALIGLSDRAYQYAHKNI